MKSIYLVDTRCRFNVYKTSIRRRRRLIEVERRRVSIGSLFYFENHYNSHDRFDNDAEELLLRNGCN